MTPSQRELTIIPLLREPKSAHLLIQSGLASASVDVDRKSFTNILLETKNPILSSDLFELGLTDELIRLAQDHHCKPALLLSFYDLLHREEMPQILAAKISIYLMKAKPLSLAEIDHWQRMIAQGFSVRVVFAETKENNLFDFLMALPEELRGQVWISYLPKVTEWDVLLSPLEVSERLYANKDLLLTYGTQIFILANDELRSCSSERRFYLSPGKEEYRRIFTEKFQHSFWSSFFSVEYLYHFLFVLGVILKKSARAIYIVFHPKEESAELRVALYNLVRYRIVDGGKNFIVRGYWRLYPVKGFIKQIFTFIYWRLRRVVQNFILLLNIARFKIYWGLKNTKFFLTHQSKMLGYNLKRVYWIVHRSWIMRPFLKVYWFLEYQYLTRVLGKTKDET